MRNCRLRSNVLAGQRVHGDIGLFAVDVSERFQGQGAAFYLMEKVSFQLLQRFLSCWGRPTTQQSESLALSQGKVRLKFHSPARPYRAEAF